MSGQSTSSDRDLLSRGMSRAELILKQALCPPREDRLSAAGSQPSALQSHLACCSAVYGVGP